MKAAERYLKEILDVMKATNGLASGYLGTDIPLLAAFTAIPTADRAASVTVDLWNLQYKGAYITLDVFVVPGAGETLQLFVDALNPVAGDYYAIAQAAATAVIGMPRYLIYPGAIDTDGELTHLTQLPLPRRWRIRVLHSATGTFTYGVGVQYLL